MPKNPHADFSPVLDGYSGIGAFRFWCQTALPLTYDDSLSYYELLNKVVNYLNHTIEDLTAVESNTSALAEAYNKLQKYVNDYFDDLDVEAELRNVLDAMAEDGTLDTLLDPLVENRLPGVVDEKIDDVVAEQIDGAVAGQIDNSVAGQLPALVSEEIPDEVSGWLNENVDPVGSAVMVDSSLTISGAAADAKITGDKITELKNKTDNLENDFYKVAFETVIDATDTREFETAPDTTVAIAHPFNFVEGKRYKLEVTVNSAVFKSQTNALRADTSQAIGTSVGYLNTALLRVNAPIENGSIFTKEFTAISNDNNLLMRYVFDAGSQSIGVKVYEYITINDKIDELDLRMDACEDSIDDINEIIYKSTVCIDATDTGEYESDPSTISKAHPFEFVTGKTYKATLTINSGSFKNETDGIRVQQSTSGGTSTTTLISGGYVFRIDHPVVGTTYTSEFVALEGCVNLLARYKWSAGTQSVDFDVTITESIDTELDGLSDSINNKYNDCIIKSRMLMGAHRGAEYYAPPNCVAAYEIAGKMGFPWAWLAQIRYSADNTLYVMHDEDVSITTNGTGNMSELTDEYINSLLCNKISGYDYSQFSDDDLRVPTLEKAIQICLRYGMKMCFRIEPLPNSMESERQIAIWTNFQTLIKAYGIADDWACYSGYNPNEMKLCRALLGENVELCPYIGAVSAQGVVDWFTTANINGNRSILLSANSLTLNDIKLLHTNGIKVYAFTNSSAPTQELMENLASWGADILQNPKYARIPIVK